MSDEGVLRFVPSRVEGLPNVTQAAVYRDRLGLLSAERWVFFRLAALAAWPRPVFIRRPLARLGWRPRWLPVGERGWFHAPRSDSSASTLGRTSSYTCPMSQQRQTTAVLYSTAFRTLCRRKASAPGTWGRAQPPHRPQPVRRSVRFDAPMTPSAATDTSPSTTSTQSRRASTRPVRASRADTTWMRSALIRCLVGTLRDGRYRPRRLVLFLAGGRDGASDSPRNLSGSPQIQMEPSPRPATSSRPSLIKFKPRHPAVLSSNV